jgi:hypothetical protein
MAQNRHWTDVNDTHNFSEEQRTYILIDKLRFTLENNSSVYSDVLTKLRVAGIDRDIDIRALINYIELNINMIKYVFDKNGKLIKIKVDPFSLFTFGDNAKERRCNMSFGITELLRSHLRYIKKTDIDIEMSNESRCKGIIGTAATTTDGFPIQDMYTAGNLPVEAGGGSKSWRRKCMRKTRRGRTRKSKSKTKAKTHRRRRHSRVRKNKKYTSRRR